MNFSQIGSVMLCLMTIGCSASPNLPATSNNIFSVVSGEKVKIKEVVLKRDRVVQVEGKINAQAPLMGGLRAFEVKDETGSVWVVTSRSVPATGSQVNVQGKVRLEKIDLAGQDQSAVYLEQQ